MTERFTEEQVDHLKQIVEVSKEVWLNEFEQDFVEGFRKRFNRFGMNTRITEGQSKLLDQIHTEVVLSRPTEQIVGEIQ